MNVRTFSSVLVSLALAACAAEDPVPSGRADGGGTDAEGFCDPGPVHTEDVSACQPRADDYRPRVANSANDTWPACISDDNVYHPINSSISTVARVAAFDQIAQLLWEGNKKPSAQDFIDARVLYAQDQGLDSRVQRREDIHYPAAPQACSTAGVPDQYPDRCVGPSKLLPILNDAFAKGAAAEAPLVQAARVEAALVWFLYVSALSEATSCTAKPQDCDSAWAYYSGGGTREAPAGLGRYALQLGAETHQRAYDGTLAVRCWRNLDNETGTATDLTTRDRARAQLDSATLRAVALTARQRFTELRCSKDEVLAARWAYVQTLVPFLDRAARERNVGLADTLKAQVEASGPENVDVDAAVAAIDGLFSCP